MIANFPLKMRPNDRFDDSPRGKIAPKGGAGGLTTPLTGKICSETIMREKNYVIYAAAKSY